MRRDEWTDERIALLQKLWADGETAVSIGGKLGGLSRSAVHGKVFRLRLHATTAAAVATKQKVDTAAQASRTEQKRVAASAVPSSAPMPARRRGPERQEPYTRERTSRARRGKSLFELTNRSCRWPHGEPGTSAFHFCGAAGADLERGMPYCPRHARRAYVAYDADARPDQRPHQTPVRSGAARSTVSPATTVERAGRPVEKQDLRASAYLWRSLVRRPAARGR